MSDLADQIEGLAVLADMRASEARRLDKAGRAREAQWLEREALRAAARCTLLAMGIDAPDPLPNGVLGLLDEAISDLALGDVASAAKNRDRLFALLAGGNTP